MFRDFYHYLPYALSFILGGFLQSRYAWIESVQGYFNKPDPNEDVRAAVKVLLDREAAKTP